MDGLGDGSTAIAHGALRMAVLGAADHNLDLLFLGLALLIAIGGGISVLAVWWTRGRDPEIGPVPDVIVTPPANLPPAVVGALVDEQVDQEDIVATLVDLGRRAVLRIDPIGAGRSGRPEGFTLSLIDDKPVLAPFERRLLNVLFSWDFIQARWSDVTQVTSWGPTKVTLSDARGALADARLEIVRLINDELVRHGFFTARPSRTRFFWTAAGAVLLLVGLVSAWVGRGWSDIAPTLWMPGAALLGLGMLVLVVARFMPHKTAAGAEAAAKWRAFQHYLQQIERFERIDEAQQLFERYLPYAIAFGIEESWVKTFSRVSTPAPQWYGADGGASSQPAGMSGLGGDESWATPNLQGLSDQAGTSLQDASTSLFDLFNSAGAAFSSGGGDGSGFGGGGDWGGDGGGGDGGGGGE